MEVENIVSVQGVKCRILGVDSSRGKSSGFGIEISISGQGKIPCAIIVGSNHYLSI